MNKFFFALLVGLVLSLAFPVNADSVFHHPCVQLKRGISSNWAGYAVQTSFLEPQDGSVSYVTGKWYVPQVNCAAAPDAYSSFWIGIDGYTSRMVEQIGTESDCTIGIAQYYGWYEMYPQDPVNLNIRISPGDLMCAEVKYLGNDQFMLLIKDMTTGEKFSINQTAPNAERSSAEWVAEAPASEQGILPLADFGIVYFNDTRATVNGITGTIDNSNWQYDVIGMTSRSGITKAVVSNVLGEGSAFYVTWSHQ